MSKEKTIQPLYYITGAMENGRRISTLNSQCHLCGEKLNWVMNSKDITHNEIDYDKYKYCKYINDIRYITFIVSCPENCFGHELDLRDVVLHTI